MKMTIQPNLYIYLAILLLILPFKWLIAWITAICFHELCHIFAVKLCGGESYRLHIGFGGAVISCSALTSKKRIVSILAGPFGGLMLVFLGRWLPRLALCSWALSVYNLLPLLPLDGGQALQLLMKNRKAFYTVERVFLIMLIFFSIFLSFRFHFGVLPVVIVGTLWLKNRNRPCKEEICKVQ